MTTTFQDLDRKPQLSPRVRPSKVDPARSAPFTLDQELKPFGTWVDAPIWVPPKDSSKEMAESMLRQSRLWTSKQKRWNAIVDEHRDSFTQVREIELIKASIRLPKGRLFVSVTEQKHFDRITDDVPDCVNTRLEEFLAGPGRKRGVKVTYLKPLCVEVDDDLIFTTRETIDQAIDKIQQEVFAEYHRSYLPRRCQELARGAVDRSLSVPRAVAGYVMERRKKALNAYQAKLEFERRKLALHATKTFEECHTIGCTFNDMLELTNPLRRDAVIEQYSFEKQLSRARQEELLRGQLPWFALAVGLSGIGMGLSYLATISLTFGPPLALCDPAFVAEFPDSPGLLMNIGHFDEIAGVRHIEF